MPLLTRFSVGYWTRLVSSKESSRFSIFLSKSKILYAVCESHRSIFSISTTFLLPISTYPFIKNLDFNTIILRMIYSLFLIPHTRFVYVCLVYALCGSMLMNGARAQKGKKEEVEKEISILRTFIPQFRSAFFFCRSSCIIIICTCCFNASEKEHRKKITITRCVCAISSVYENVNEMWKIWKQSRECFHCVPFHSYERE